MAEKDMWYFSYGSNLKMEQIRERIGEWSASKRATLIGYRLVFNVSSPRWGGLAANVLQTDNNNDKVYGAIYNITTEQLDKMTKYEGCQPQDITVESNSNDIFAKTYVFATPRKPGKPPDRYLDIIIIGLKQHGYSEEIISKVKKAALL